MARGTLSTHLSIFMPMCQCKNMFTSAEPFAGFPRQASCSLPFPVVRASHFPLRAASGFSTMTSSMASSEKARVLGWAKFRAAKLRAAHPPQRCANKKERAAETCEMLSGTARLSYAPYSYATELKLTVPPVQHTWRSHHMWPPNVPMQLNSEAE